MRQPHVRSGWLRTAICSFTMAVYTAIIHSMFQAVRSFGAVLRSPSTCDIHPVVATDAALFLQAAVVGEQRMPFTSIRPMRGSVAGRLFRRATTSSLPSRALTSNIPGPLHAAGHEQSVDRHHLADLQAMLLQHRIEAWKSSTAVSVRAGWPLSDVEPLSAGAASGFQRLRSSSGSIGALSSAAIRW
jgi:hypothetical protein